MSLLGLEPESDFLKAMLKSFSEKRQLSAAPSWTQKLRSDAFQFLKHEGMTHFFTTKHVSKSQTLEANFASNQNPQSVCLTLTFSILGLMCAS